MVLIPFIRIFPGLPAPQASASTIVSAPASALPSLTSLICLGLLSTLWVGCEALGRVAHGDPAVQVVIKTDPPGAKVILDGQVLGESPVS